MGIVRRGKCMRGTVKVERIPLLNPEAAEVLRAKGRNTSLLGKVVEVKTCETKKGDIALKVARVKNGRPTRQDLPMRAVAPAKLPAFPRAPAAALPRMKALLNRQMPIPGMMSPVRRPPSAMPSSTPLRLGPGLVVSTPAPSAAASSSAASAAPVKSSSAIVPVPKPIQPDTSAAEPYGMNGLGCGMRGIGCMCPDGSLGCSCDY